jgi:hypothetical protein
MDHRQEFMRNRERLLVAESGHWTGKLMNDRL